MWEFFFFLEEVNEGLEKQIISGEEERGFILMKKIFRSIINQLAYCKKNILGNSSPKFQKLIEIITDKQNIEKMKKNEMKILIFVDKRMIAHSMNSVMNEFFSETQQNVGYIVGQSSKDHGRPNEISPFHQKKKLLKFQNIRKLKKFSKGILTK